MKIKFLITTLLITVYSLACCQIKYFSTFTVINNGEGIDVNDDIELNIEVNSLSLKSKTFSFSNAIATGKNEVYNDSKKGVLIAAAYETNYYSIVLMKYLKYPEENFLKIYDKKDYSNYLIHLHNK